MHSFLYDIAIISVVVCWVQAKERKESAIGILPRERPIVDLSNDIVETRSSGGNGTWSTTDDISDKALRSRAQLYAGIIACGVAFLMAMACIISIRKTGKCEIPILKCVGWKHVRLQNHDILTEIKWCCQCLNKTCCKKEAQNEYEEINKLAQDLEATNTKNNRNYEIIPMATPAVRPTTDTAKVTTAEFGHKVAENFKRNAQVQIWKSRRGRILSLLFCLYIAVCTYVPWRNSSHTSCGHGFFWEDHFPFAASFFLSQVVEIVFYMMDPSLDGVLPMWQFLLLFAPSFLGYVDAYQDYTSTFISQACFEHPTPGVDRQLAGLLASTMTWSFWIGVVFLQWGCLGFLAIFYDGGDASLALLAKLLHMDALSMCTDVPKALLWMVYCVNMVRLFGEDLLQAVQQTFFVIHVKKNSFMVVSIMFSIICSMKALYDACNRLANAAGHDLRVQEIVEERLATIRELRKENRLNPVDLKSFGYSLQEVFAAGCEPPFTPTEIMHAGWSYEDYREIGAMELQNAGFLSDDIAMTDNFSFEERFAAYGEAPRFENRIFGDNYKRIWNGGLYLEVNDAYRGRSRWFEGNFLVEWGRGQTWLGRQVDDDKLLTILLRKSYDELEDDEIRSANPTYHEYFKATYADGIIHNGSDDSEPYDDECVARMACDADGNCKGYFCHAISGKFHLVHLGEYTYSSEDDAVRYVKTKRSQATIDGEWIGGDDAGSFQIFGDLMLIGHAGVTRKIERLSAISVKHADVTYELQADGRVRSTDNHYWRRVA